MYVTCETFVHIYTYPTTNSYICLLSRKSNKGNCLFVIIYQSRKWLSKLSIVKHSKFLIVYNRTQYLLNYTVIIFVVQYKELHCSAG